MEIYSSLNLLILIIRILFCNFLLQHDHFAKLLVTENKLVCLSRDGGKLAEVPDLSCEITKIYRFGSS